MTREEAEAQCAQLTAEHPDRVTHQWRPRRGTDDSWDVVKIALPAADSAHLHTETRADEKPPSADDPRTSYDRNVGPFGGGGI